MLWFEHRKGSCRGGIDVVMSIFFWCRDIQTTLSMAWWSGACFSLGGSGVAWHAGAVVVMVVAAG
jgi:hypothetical protein